MPHRLKHAVPLAEVVADTRAHPVEGLRRLAYLPAAAFVERAGRLRVASEALGLLREALYRPRRAADKYDDDEGEYQRFKKDEYPLPPYQAVVGNGERLRQLQPAAVVHPYHNLEHREYISRVFGQGGLR